jgi:hypothetical protein
MTSDHNHQHIALDLNSSRTVPGAFVDFLNLANQPPAVRVEQNFRALDVQPGDRVRLRKIDAGPLNPSRLALKDASTLEGVVTRVKQKKGESRIQIDGFAVAGNNVFWPIKDYRVEVLHRAYRWTDDDRLVVEISGLSRHQWEGMSETGRQRNRESYKNRVERIKNILTPSQGEGVE